MRGGLVGAVLALLPATVAQPVVAGFERFYADASTSAAEVGRTAEGGLLLINELNCVACHAAPDNWREQLPGGGRIGLAGVGQRLDVAALREFIADPGKMKAGTTMPRLAINAAEAEGLAAYLETLVPAGAAKAVTKSFPTGDAKRGRALYERVGCAACHAPANGGVPTQYVSVPLGLAAHYERSALAAFLQDPLATRPAGRMPATELTDAEAADLAAYVQSGTAVVAAKTTVASTASVPRGDVAAGRGLFATRSCAACHDTASSVESTPTPKPARSLAEVRAGEGCLEPKPAAGLPDFSLSDTQRQALAAALHLIQSSRGPVTRTAEARVTARFEQLNCYACHEWRGRGGPEAVRAKLFVATDSAAESLGELGHLPPRLDTAGRKLTPAWLKKLLWGQGGGVRPYMTARMPRFGREAAGDLVPLLAEACRPAEAKEIDTSGSRGHQRFQTGRALLGTGADGLGCVSCHGIKNREPSGVRAINLTHTAQRIRPEYFMALLLDPQGAQPGTIMPPLLAGRNDARKVVESVWTYFKELDQSDVLPEGLGSTGSFELKPANEGRPIVFRTFLEGAGTQAVAVGFPAGVHAAFDAFEVRWALVWRGRFLDAQTNWEERPMKPIKALGENRLVLPTHLPLAKLPDTTAPWPAKFGAYAGYVFKGYRLAADGTPIFRYALGGIEVEDTLRPAPDGASLRRTLTLHGGNDGDAAWYFRGLGAGVSPQPVIWRNGTAVIEETISW